MLSPRVKQTILAPWLLLNRTSSSVVQVLPFDMIAFQRVHKMDLDSVSGTHRAVARVCKDRGVKLLSVFFFKRRQEMTYGTFLRPMAGTAMCLQLTDAFLSLLHNHASFRCWLPSLKGTTAYQAKLAGNVGKERLSGVDGQVLKFPKNSGEAYWNWQQQQNIMAGQVRVQQPHQMCIVVFQQARDRENGSFQARGVKIGPGIPIRSLRK
jgi:hypothetical protein